MATLVRLSRSCLRASRNLSESRAASLRCSLNISMGGRGRRNCLKILLGSSLVKCAGPLNQPEVKITQAPKLEADSLPRSILVFLRDFLDGLWTFLRALHISVICFPLFITGPMAYYRPSWREAWFKRLVSTLESCGPIFVKLGQWASTRRDLFPAELCSELSVLQRETVDATPSSFGSTL